MTTIKGDDDIIDKTKLLLQEQYQVTEAFANAQSRSYNATLLNSSYSPTSNNNNAKELTNAIDRLMESHEDVRSNLRRLYNHQKDERRSYLQEHLELSRRVIETISSNPSWHANGIPMMVNNEGALESNTVALASLKASIARVLER